MLIKAFSFSLVVLIGIASIATASIYECSLNPAPRSWVSEYYKIAVTPSKQVKIIDRVIYEFNDKKPIVAEKSDVTSDAIVFSWHVDGRNENGVRHLLFNGVLWLDSYKVEIFSKINNGSRRDRAKGTCKVIKP